MFTLIDRPYHRFGLALTVCASSLTLLLVNPADATIERWAKPGEVSRVSEEPQSGPAAWPTVDPAALNFERLDAFSRPVGAVPEPDPSAEVAAEAEAEGPGVDLTALNFYAAQNDIPRVAAEIRRLRARHPDWQPPESVFDTARLNVDEQPLWALYGEGRLDDIYRAIEEIRRESPTYVPSDDLLNKLRIAEARRAIANAMETRRYARVLELSGTIPQILVCDEMQILWHVAEARARTNDLQGAHQIYSQILNDCEKPEERLATMQKAGELLPDATFAGLLNLGRVGFDGRNEFEPVVLDRLRGTIGRAIGDGGPQPSADDIARFEAIAGQTIDDSLLIAWYHYNTKDYDKSKTWFDSILVRTFNVKALEGYILSLRRSGNLDEARDIARSYANEDKAIARHYIYILADTLTDDDPTPVPASHIATLKAVIEEHQSALGAQSLAWYLYNEGDAEEARTWFARSVDWEPTEEGVLGLAVAENKLGNRKGVTQLAIDHGEDFPVLAAFVDRLGPPPRPRAKGTPRSVQQARRSRGRSGSGRDRLAAEAVKAYEAGDYDTAIARINARKAQRGEDRGLSVLKAWALHNSGQHRRAHAEFDRLEKRRSTKETRQGRNFAWQRMMPPQFRDGI